jgi:hypothetical protein
VSAKTHQPYLTVYDVIEAGAWSGDATFKRDASPDRVAATVRALVEANAELVSLRAEVERLRARGEALAKALDGQLARIDSEPTMSGHLRGMRLRPDHGETHATRDAIRGAEAALAEWEKP